MADNEGEVSAADSIPGALYQALVYPGKGLTAARRDYQYGQYVSELEDRGIDEVELRLAMPDSDQINPFFYVPRYHVEISPRTGIPETEEPPRRAEGFWWTLARWLVPRRWSGDSAGHTVTVYGSKPESAYEKAGKLYWKWLDDLEARGFTVRKDYEIPRGLRERFDEADRPPS